MSYDITRAMIQAVRKAETFYEGEDLDRESICHAAMEHSAFDSWWNKHASVCQCDSNLDRFIQALMKAVWSKRK